MTADISVRPSALRRAGSVAEKAEKQAPEPRPEPKPEPALDAAWDWWRLAPRFAVVGIFILMFGALLYFARSLIAPIVAAAVFSIMFGPIATRAARAHMPPALLALACVGLVVLAANIGMI